MHGGVSLPKPLTHRELDEMKFFWGDAAEKNGWFLAIPSGETGAEWWTPVGAGNVLSILDTARRTYDIDENRVLATGFSDGGSGSFYLALAAPTVLAGVVPLNGHMSVAQAGGLEVHLRNFVDVPVYAINTDNDQLYPAAGVKPIFDALKELGAPVTWREIKGFGHDPSYLSTERPAIWTWIDAARRDPQPTRLVWEGTEPGRVRWLNVTQLGQPEFLKDFDFPDINPKLPPGRARIGVVADQGFEGTGVLVKDVQDGMPAAGMGMKAGDVITGLDGSEIGSMRDLQEALQGKKFGDGFKIRFRRGEEVLEKEGKFPDAGPEEAFRRGGSWSSIEAQVKENVVDVRTRRISAFEIFLSEPLFDLSKPITVKVNGETVHAGLVAPDLRFLVEQAAADGDRSMVYLARLKVPAR